MQKFLTIYLIFIFLCSTLTYAVTCPSRVRQSWDAITKSQQALFISAVQLAMDRGLYQIFIQIHAEQMSNREAHGSCVFLFWHRQFILGFENMLRSLGPQYACITLPYYNFVQHYANFQAGKCKTFETCSQVLLDLGGSTNGNIISQTIYNRVITRAVCVNSPPLNHFCDNSSVCAHCVARGPWQTRPPPFESGFATVHSALFTSPDIKSMSARLETTTHNVLHNKLSGAMGSTTMSPADPIFFVLHAAMDALYTIFYKCKASSLQLKFQGCTTRNNQTIGPSSTILMQYNLPNGKLISATDPSSPVAPFFSKLPNAYYKLADTATLGTGNSYVYEFKELLGQLFTRCDGSNISRRRLDSPQQQIVRPAEKWQTWNVLAHRYEVHSIGKSLNMTISDVNNEIFKMQLLHHNTCLVKLDDYSQDFKNEWHIKGTRPSISLLDQLASGDIQIRIPNWRDINAKYFPCPLHVTK